MDTIPNGTIPNGHNPEWTLFRMDPIPNGHNSEWTQSQIGHHPEWTRSRKDTYIYRVTLVFYSCCLVRFFLQRRGFK